jgi:TM2 domain-containing membrane protein YozV
MIAKPRSRRVAALLALAGAIPIFGGFHIVGLHKLYVGQRWWCLIYIALALTGSKAAWIAGLFDAIFYLIQNPDEFDANFNEGSPVEVDAAGIFRKEASDSIDAVPPARRSTVIAETLRELDQLREDGLVSEYEFEQKRRKLLEKI